MNKTTLERYTEIKRICEINGWGIETSHDPGPTPTRIIATVTFTDQLKAAIIVEASGITTWIECGHDTQEARDARDEAAQALADLRELAHEMRLHMLPKRWKP